MAAPILSVFRSRVFDCFRSLIAGFDKSFVGPYQGFAPAFALDFVDNNTTSPETSYERPSASSILNDIIGNGLLWAVPTSRRTLEKRHTRNRCPEKMHKLQNNLRICMYCGHFHEVHTICGNCYEKVKAETKAMQEAINSEWKYDIVDKDVVVLYDEDGTSDEMKDNKEFWEGKRIVEMKKPRPEWFHRNLRVKTNTPRSDGAVSRPSSSIIPRIK